ncbi:hypothetical protein [Rheinheimera sp.]|uniref:hypothetical protein n=1 Tax=Rheinheimera sp. TaxID=1869214 RepID=UPI0027B91357|nr:hypothetical protein [Rheinheimera sp.]
MSVAVSQNIIKSPNVAEVFTGRQPRAIAPNTTATDKTSASPQGNGVKSSAAVLSLLDDERQSSERTGYDNPAGQHQRALEAYKSLANQQKREEIQQMFSVDLFA